MELEETHNNIKYKVTINEDQNAENPRDFYSNLGTFALFHKRYNLANETPLKSEDFDTMDEIESKIKEEYKPLYVFEVSGYDHSGFSINLGGSRCRWDGGTVGFIFVTEEKLKEMGIENNKDTIHKRIEEEVQDYNHYLSGEVYIIRAFKVLKETHTFRNGNTQTVTDEEELDDHSGFTVYGYREAEKEARNTMDKIKEGLKNV